MEDIILGIVLCVVYILVFVGIRLYKYITENKYRANLYTKIGWIAEKKHPMKYYKDVNLRDEELIYYIVKEQRRLNIPEHLCIDFSNENEKNYAEEILNLHKDSVTKSYYSDFLSKSKDICKLNSLEYYFYSLYCFIYKELEEYHYQDEIYMKKEYSDKSHFSCQLTDYGRVYYKLYLITNIFVEKNEKTRRLFKYINPQLKNHITEYLEKNEVVFWSYRP